MYEQNTFKITWKKAGKSKKFIKNLAKKSNNHRILHRTSSTRNNYERKNNYDWPYLTEHISHQGSYFSTDNSILEQLL